MEPPLTQKGVRVYTKGKPGHLRLNQAGTGKKADARRHPSHERKGDPAQRDLPYGERKKEWGGFSDGHG